MGATTVKLNSSNTSQASVPLETDKEAIKDLGSIGVTFIFNKINIGGFYGYDYAFGMDTSKWNYNKKPWLRIAIDYSLLNFKTTYVGLMRSAQVNVNACNAIIKKHIFLNRIGQKRYDSNTFTKQEKVSFNKNLDLLNDKLKQIGDLEDKRNFLSFYNDKASDKEATESYSLSTYYNTTSRVYKLREITKCQIK